MELQILGTTTDPAAHAVHQQHLAALGGSVPSAVSTPIVGASLHRQLRDSTASLKQAAVAAADGAKAALFASIAASHEVLTHE